jgi:hypothetical protein
MKINIILASFIIIISGCVSLHVDNSVDGYALFIQACDLHESLYCDSDGDAWKEMVTFRNHGGTISKTRTLQIIEEQQSVFNLIAKATAVELWELPDNTTYSAASTFPHISSWLRINRVATAHSIQLFLEDKPQDTLAFLAPFNTTGQKLSKSGTLMHILVYIASRSMQYPVLASAIDELPDALLHEELGRAKTQYALIPKISECLLGEQHMAINTAKELFADLHNQLTQDRMKMIQDLKKAGFDDKTLKQIEEEDLFSVSDWEHQVLSDLRRLQSFYTNALASRSSFEMSKLDDEIEAEMDKIGNDIEHDTAMAAWSLFMTNQISSTFSITEAKRLHSQVGSAISHHFLSVLMPAIGSFGHSISGIHCLRTSSIDSTRSSSLCSTVWNEPFDPPAACR